MVLYLGAIHVADGDDAEDAVGHDLRADLLVLGAEGCPRPVGGSASGDVGALLVLDVDPDESLGLLVLLVVGGMVAHHVLPQPLRHEESHHVLLPLEEVGLVELGDDVPRRRGGVGHDEDEWGVEGRIVCEGESRSLEKAAARGGRERRGRG